MGNDYSREAGRQYLKYFRIWFIIIGILALVLAVVAGVWTMANSAPRRNTQAPAERVYDYAEVLTEEEEESLRRQIAKVEKKLRMDIVIVTFSQPVEGPSAENRYGSGSWEINMRNIADDIWDESGYGYDRSFEGDGVLLLHNWYEDSAGSQNGEHMSTSGEAMYRLSDYDMDDILDKVDRYYETDPYRAYSEYVKALEKYLDRRGSGPLPLLLIVFAPIIVAFVYARWNLHQEKAKDTTAVNAYVAGGAPRINFQRDDFIRKAVTSRHIERSSGGGGSGGRSHSGGGGYHRSSSGASHGGRSHRH